ncbi:MAG: hypothetical protein AMXMBFR25_10410 [Lysobacterales bacterium]
MALRSVLADSPPTAWLVAGDEPLLALEAAEEIRREARSRHTGERLVFDVDSRFDWDRWRMQVQSLGLFASRRLIELRLAAPRLTADGDTAIAAFLADPGADILLVQIPEWSKALESQSWVAALDRVGVLVLFRPLRPDQLPHWLCERARRLGVTLGEDAVAELAARVEGNLLAAQQELAKLALLAPGASIDAAQLLDLIADSARYHVFALWDAVLAGDGERVRRVLGGLRREGTHPAEIFGYIANQAITLAGAQALRERGGSLRAYWPTRGVFGPRQRVSEQALARGNWVLRLAEAQRVDLACKGRESGEPWVELERWLQRATLPSARAARFAA